MGEAAGTQGGLEAAQEGRQEDPGCVGRASRSQAACDIWAEAVALLFIPSCPVCVPDFICNSDLGSEMGQARPVGSEE